MIEQLKEINEIYDLLALCASYILKEIEKTPYEFGLFDDKKFDEISNVVERYCCERQERGERKAFDELRDSIIEFMASGVTVEKCFAVVWNIDDKIEVQVNNKLLSGKHVIKYSSLNNRYKDCVRIIPKTKGTFLDRGDIQFKSVSNNLHSLFRKRRECVCSPLDKETSNYMIWDKAHIDMYPM